MRGETIAQSFTDNLNGTVTDNVTGLMWQQEDDNQPRNWESALAYCDDLNLGGHLDWRLPDVKELRSIVDNTRWVPAIDTTVFPGTDSHEAGPEWWSSSTTRLMRDRAWFVSFQDGRVDAHYKTLLARYVRCVR